MKNSVSALFTLQRIRELLAPGTLLLLSLNFTGCLPKGTDIRDLYNDYRPYKDIQFHDQYYALASMSATPGNPGKTTYALSGPLVASISLTVPGTAEDMTVGDLDHDGRSGDAAFAMGGTDNVTVVRLSGVTLLSPVVYPVGINPLAVTSGDVNGDQFPDLVTANAGSYTTGDVSLLLGKSDGTFAPAIPLTAGTDPRDVSLGDFNGDGKLDMAVADGAGTRVIVRMGLGNGAFGPDVSVATAQTALAVRVLNFNPDVDSYPDIVTNGTVLLGHGDGIFAPAVNIAQGYTPATLRIADVNHDQKPDIILGTTSIDLVTVLLGKGDGTVETPRHYPLLGSPSAIGFSDVADGSSRLVLSGGHDGTVLEGRKEGSFNWVQAIPAAPNLGLNAGAFGATVADFTGDGIPDVVATNSGPPVILPGLGGGRLGPAVNLPGQTGNRPRVVSGDWNADGKPDLAFAGTNGGAPELTILLNQGGGVFGAPVSKALPAAVNTANPVLLTALVNGDAFPDLLVSNPASGTVSVFLGSASGAFTEKPAVPVNTPATSVIYSGGITTGDFNGDHFTDIAVAWAGKFTAYDGGLMIALGNGDGTFQTPQTLRGSIAGLGAAAADFNNDGKLDLALALEAPEYDWDVVIYPGNGNGTFATPKPMGLNLDLLRGVVVADGDRDGKPDLAVPADGDLLYAFRGLGDGTFVPAATFPAGAGVPLFPDLNQDGWPDLLNPSERGYLAVYINEAPGPIPASLPGITATSTGLIVDWPAAYPEYALHESADPRLPFALSTRPVTTANGFSRVTVNPAAAKSGYFRLEPK